MPVVNISISLLNKLFPGKDLNELIDSLPYIGLDIEGIDNETIRVEYNPNRPDFASGYGIVRALKGILDIETGIPKLQLFKNNIYKIYVESSVKQVRPVIVALVAKKNGVHDNETIKQLISIQEDLHNGIGRRRKKASIGIHDLDTIKFPITYKTVSDDFSFVPLGEISSNTIKQILNESDSGRKYGHILEKSNRYPIIVDEDNNVLSFPPIINGNVTKVTPETKNLFIEITANNQKTAEDILAILAITFHDIGFEIHNVSIKNSGMIEFTPKMDTLSIDVDVSYINSILGLELTRKEIVLFLKKSRLDAYAADEDTDIITCVVPRYRTDILHAIDIVEEVAIGYGVYNLKPTMSAWNSVGQKSSLSIYFDIVRRTLAGLNMLEVVNFSLVNKNSQYELMGLKTPDNVLTVDATKSKDHEVLRTSMIPSLLQSLSHNVHSQYPQKLFEIGKIFYRDNTIKEIWCLAAVIAHNDADFTEIKSIMQTFLKVAFDKDVLTQENANSFFIEGRSARVILDKKHNIGIIGEVTPLAIDNFKIRVPVSAFELNLSQLLGI
ncbi:MAG TPA: phenylalanine--tRNA ligase subunit beta [Nitrososphaeraceae archaeon]|nr:phenylalanine--tRNA ligase subunit beta [Nitrososphaeraceae archaeon]